MLPAITIAQIALPIDSKDIYVYNTLKDTIYLTKIKLGKFCFCDPLKRIDSLQINGTGSKEFVFHRTCKGVTSDHGGTFDIDESIELSKYEIWDLDEKTLLFEAVNYYYLNYNRFVAYETPSHQKGTTSYHYNFACDRNGHITISKLEVNNVRETNQNEKKQLPKQHMLPDHEEGIYKFINGIYIKE